MAYYEHIIKARLNHEQAEKVKNSGLTDTEFLREAIDQYNNTVDQQVLDEKIKYYKYLLKKSNAHYETRLEEIVTQIEEVKEKIVVQILEQKKEEQEKLEDIIQELQEQKKIPIKVTKPKKTHEIEEIIPTLQRMYKVTHHFTDKQLKWQAEKIGWTTKDLRLWIESHEEVLSSEKDTV